MTTELDVLVIRGAPAAGKSTLGRGLRRVLARGVVLEVDDFRGMLSQVDWGSREDHDVALDATLAAITTYLSHQRRPVVLIDTFSRSRLTSVHARLDAACWRHHTLSLWLEPKVLERRLSERETGFKEWEPSRVLNDEVRNNRCPAERFVDATDLDREAMLAMAMAVIGAFKESPKESPDE